MSEKSGQFGESGFCLVCLPACLLACSYASSYLRVRGYGLMDYHSPPHGSVPSGFCLISLCIAFLSQKMWYPTTQSCIVKTLNSLFATFADLHVRKRATFADLHSYTHAYCPFVLLNEAITIALGLHCLHALLIWLFGILHTIYR